MSSLQDLLTQEGFRRRRTRKQSRPTKPTDRRSASPSGHPTGPAAISLCRDRRSVDLSRKRRSDHRSFRATGPPSFSSGRTNSNSSGSNSRLRAPSHELWPEEEDVAGDLQSIPAVISILSGYIGRFLKDEGFRKRVREKCMACLAERKDAAHVVFVNLHMGMENIERLAADTGTTKDSKIRSLRNSIRLLSIVASLNSSKSRHGFTCGVPNSHLSACAQLYLSIVYKIERNDRISARHLLHVFCDAPYLARRNLLPELWEQFFLPHLLHLKVWYNKEMDMVSGLDVDERNQNMKGLNRVYNDQMDLGTAQFAVYYKEWLKVGGKNPVVPSVTLPSRSSYHVSSGKRSLSVSPCSVNRNLYQVVFGAQHERGNDGHVDFDDRGSSDSGEEDGNCKFRNVAHTQKGFHRRCPRGGQENTIKGSVPTPRKSYSFRLFTCQNDTYRGAICRSQIPKTEPIMMAKETNATVPLINLGRAITLISTSDSLSECETAVRVVANAWLDSQGDPVVETALSSASVIEGLLEVSFTSKDDEVLELAISIIAELVARNEVNRQVVLNADPQLEIFLRLLGSKNLFLKTAILLYILRPKAKQMLSMDWVPLVLRVLEFGDQPQTLFAVQCSPKSAACYLLDQLLTGFDVDRNVENAKQVVALGGLSLLIRRLEMGDARERKNAASFLATCVRADGSCREYLATNIKKASILELFTWNQLKSNGHALSLLVELLCLRRRTQITNFLIELKNEGCLNTMHILLVYLQQSPTDQRPLVAAILLHLDLLADPSQYSIYREEGIDTIIGAMDCTNSKRVQEKCSKALLVLGGRFSSMGEAATESWLLKRAGIDDCPADLYSSREILTSEIMPSDDEENETEEWLRRLASVLLTRGNKRFLVALSNCITNGIPCLARSCLVTVAWMSNSLSLLQNASGLWSLVCSILTPRLLESLKYDRALEERVLASVSLLNFARNSECLSKILPLSREIEILLQDLTRFTWTAKEILFLAASDPTSVVRL